MRAVQPVGLALRYETEVEYPTIHIAHAAASINRGY